MLRVADLRMREIVNVLDGRRLGLVSDLDIDLEYNRVRALVVPGQTRMFGIFGREEDVRIPWEQVLKIGTDVILVELDGER